jgi:hypothetical protein
MLSASRSLMSHLGQSRKCSSLHGTSARRVQTLVQEEQSVGPACAILLSAVPSYTSRPLGKKLGQSRK